MVSSRYRATPVHWPRGFSLDCPVADQHTRSRACDEEDSAVIVVGDDLVANLVEALQGRIRVAELERENARLRKDASSVAIEMLSQLMTITTSLFKGEAAFFESFDPEFPDDRHHVIAVQTPLSPSEVVDAESEWVKAMIAFAPDWESLRLSIRPSASQK